MVLGMPRAQVIWLGALVAVLALAQINPPYPQTALLQHIPTALAIIAAPFVQRRFQFSNAAFACLIAFFILHTIGGIYAYSMVPYDDWWSAVSTESLSAQFGWTRNHYDRLVHFAFGALFTLPVIELMARRAFSLRMGIVAAIAFVLSASCLYEIFEWGLTLAMASEFADRYNGQQGDMWDAQKDMALAFVGSLLSSALILARPGNRTGQQS